MKALVALLLLFPLAAAAAPSRDPQVVVPLLQHWDEHGSFVRLESILGPPDAESIAGFSITAFRLSDGTSIYVKATPSHHRIYAIDRRAPGRLAETLYEPLAGDLDQPLPASMPY